MQPIQHFTILISTIPSRQPSLAPGQLANPSTSAGKKKEKKFKSSKERLARPNMKTSQQRKETQEKK